MDESDIEMSIDEARPELDGQTSLDETGEDKLQENNDQNRQHSKIKQSYAAFLIDRPFNATETQDDKDTTLKLMNCLRYRLNLGLYSKGIGNNKSEDDDAAELEALIALSLGSSSSSSSMLTPGTKESPRTNKKSLYDTLLKLLDEFDAAGVAEIFRLLLERRSAIPLFVPDSKTHFLNLMRHVTLPGMDNIRLGEDKSLMRIAVVSCRQRKQSQASEILKSLFNIDSVYCHDFSAGSVSSKSLLAEIGSGCVQIGESGPEKVKHVLVTHVIGDFKPLWPFLQHFADYLLIEDSSVENETFSVSSFMSGEQTSHPESNEFPFFCVWKPSVDETRCEIKELNGFRQFRIDGQLAGKTIGILKSSVVAVINKINGTNQSRERLRLFQIPLLMDAGYRAVDCVSPTEIQSRITKSAHNLREIKTNEFLLQKNYMEQAKHEETKMEHRLNEEKVREEDAKIKKCREVRRSDSYRVEKHPLLQLFISLLLEGDPGSRVLSIRILEKELVGRCEQTLGPQLQEIRKLNSAYVNKLASGEGSSVASGKKDVDETREKLFSAKAQLRDGVLNIEHLWRELSHLCIDMEPKSRSAVVEKIPVLAAQHLLDGFCLELLDGDSNMIHLEWITEVLRQLEVLTGNMKRIFVLSVIGMQSSGKSTLLNTMFGIQMRTSVGQCTRGVNMQLVPVEGRAEYDYILLLDTEGTRAPEYHGMPDSDKRDNQMATLSILLADATIVIAPGENDAAIKEILPVVLMAYQGSMLAEKNGGRLSSKVFFVYNRIDTSQKNKLSSIIQSLGTSLHEAFSQVQKLVGYSALLKSEASPFGGFDLDVSNSSDEEQCDVCILGNVKKEYEPPGDTPDFAFGETLVKLREHIHRRVTSVVQDGTAWRSRLIKEISSYITDVWKCICSANFTLNFASVVERITFDQFHFEYKKVEQELVEVYLESFATLKKKMIEEKGENITSGSTAMIDATSNDHRLLKFETQLRDEILPAELTLDNKVKYMVKKKGREKWSLHFQKLWEMNKKDQARNWAFRLKTSFVLLFNYEHHVENYKKKMRKEIHDFFKFHSMNSNNFKWTVAEKNKKFEELYNNMLAEVYQQFPPKDIRSEVLNVYQNSPIIKNRKIDLKLSDTDSSFFSKMKQTCFDFFSSANQKKNLNPLDECLKCAFTIGNSVARNNQCYDDSIISKFIYDVDAIITSHNIYDNSRVREIHIYGQQKITDVMEIIGRAWDYENSVLVKLQRNKADMREYFMMVSQGVEKTKLFATTMANNLKRVLISAFEKEMIQKAFNIIRNRQWLFDARLMHKHMDLYLIDLLDEQKVDEVLDCIYQPQNFYADVLHRLIAQNVTNVDKEWQDFTICLKQAIKKAALGLTKVESGKAQNFVNQLRSEFLKGGLQNELLASAFLTDFSGEYEDCGNEEDSEFQDACTKEMILALDNQEPPKNQKEFAKELSPKVVQYMKIRNDPVALPRCDAYCGLCRSLCIEGADHDPSLTPHDAIHQPAGITGMKVANKLTLVSDTCSESYQANLKFRLSDTSEWQNYTDYGKVFPGWKDPRINEESPVREYIFATYNEQIAKKYKKNPCPDVPAKYFRDLSTIREQLKRDIGGI